MSENRDRVKFPRVNVAGLTCEWNLRLEILIENGFEFTEISGDDDYLMASLPEGWIIEHSSSGDKLIDNNGFERAYSINLPNYYRFEIRNERKSKDAICPAMYWKTRYDIISDDGRMIFGNSEEVLYKDVYDSDDWEETYMATENWARRNYPGYDNPFTYWNINLEKAPQKSLGTQKTDK